MNTISNGALALAASTLMASGGLFYDESVSGDISGNRFLPTSFGTLQAGVNTLRGSVDFEDLDYVTFTVPLGMRLESMTLTRFVSTDDVAFVGIREGTIFPPTPGQVVENVGLLLGWSHFGTGGAAGPARLGTDILDNIGSGDGAQGFTPPLPAGAYTLWLQQTSAQPVSYGFEFAAVPEPMQAVWVGGAIFAGAVARRTIQRRRRTS